LSKILWDLILGSFILSTYSSCGWNGGTTTETLTRCTNAFYIHIYIYIYIYFFFFLTVNLRIILVGD
jgi:hypothetical protein